MEWIQRSQKGDSDAFGLVYNQYKNLVYRTAFLMLGHAGEAEDALQEVFLKVYRSIASYDPRKGAFSTWLYRITANHCINVHRAEEPEPLPIEAAGGENPVEMALDGEPLEAALDRLSVRLRAVIVLRYYADLSYGNRRGARPAAGHGQITAECGAGGATSGPAKRTRPGKCRSAGGNTMNHDEIRAMMAAYVDDELPGSQRKLVEGHVAGCAGCRAELAAVTALQRQLRKTLKTRAEIVEAPAESWATLQGRMASEPVPAVQTVGLAGSKNHSRGAAEAPAGRRVLRAFSLGFALVGALVFMWLVIVSPLIGQQTAGPDKRKKTPTPADQPTPVSVVVTEVATADFTPLSARVLPEGLAYMNDASPKDGSRVMTFYNRHGDDFLSVTQTGYAPGDLLPDEGVEAAVGNLPARLTTGVKGRIKVGEKNERTINYKDAIRLTWQTPFGTRLTAVSNLPEQKVSMFAALMSVNFTHFAPDISAFGDEYIVGNGMEGVDAGLVVSESHTYSVEQFVVLIQMPDIAGEAITGDPIILSNGVEAAITRGLSGEASAESHEFFDGRDLTMLGGGGGGGGGGPDFQTPDLPQTIPYSDAVRLVWSQDGTLIDLLSNLPEDKVLAYAVSMQSQPQINELLTGAFIDRSVLPEGGALAGYVTTAPSLPTDFYGESSVTVTEGDGLIIEHRYFSNTQFAIITTRRDDGSPLPKGDPLPIGGQSGVVQTGQKGTALLGSQGDNGWLMTLQDGEPRLIISVGGGGGVKNATGPEQTYPSTIAYKDGLQITWTLDGARITLVTNLSLGQARATAESVSILGKDFTLISPVGSGWQGQIFADSYDLWAPTYLPDTLLGLGMSDPGGGMESQPEVLFWNPEDPTQFVLLKQRAARPDEFVMTPLSIVLLGQPVLIEEVSGSYEFRYAETPKAISYSNATRITVIVDGTWIQIITPLPREEALKIAESMVKGQ